MQEPNIRLLQDFSETDFFNDPKGTNKFMGDLSALNEKSVKQAIQEERLPKEIQAPTANELEVMAVWMNEYKRLTPKASKREIRKACQAHFNVRIFRKPYKS